MAKGIKGKYPSNKYDHPPTGSEPFSGETRTVTNPSPDSIVGTGPHPEDPVKTEYAKYPGRGRLA